jgi:murein DD-endopeptidase MepM/ murein hydrolase activator NlpD
VVHTGPTRLAVVVLDSNSPFYQLEFRYIHVTNRISEGPVSAGTKLAEIINHSQDPNSDATHLHFEVYDQTKGRIIDCRQFLNPGLVPNP